MKTLLTSMLKILIITLMKMNFGNILKSEHDYKNSNNKDKLRLLYKLGNITNNKVIYSSLL